MLNNADSSFSGTGVLFCSEVGFFKLLKSRNDAFESSVDVLSGFGTCKYNFARSENQQADFRVEHMVNQTWKLFWIEVAILGVPTLIQSLKLNFKSY